MKSILGGMNKLVQVTFIACVIGLGGYLALRGIGIVAELGSFVRDTFFVDHPILTLLVTGCIFGYFYRVIQKNFFEKEEGEPKPIKVKAVPVEAGPDEG